MKHIKIETHRSPIKTKGSTLAVQAPIAMPMCHHNTPGAKDQRQVTAINNLKRFLNFSKKKSKEKRKKIVNPTKAMNRLKRSKKSKTKTVNMVQTQLTHKMATRVIITTMTRSWQPSRMIWNSSN